jgi:glycosyltransferase involved in cell wall biosynthesis
MAERVRRQTRKQVELIPSWVHPEEIRPIPKQENPFAKEHGFDRGLNVLYSGNLGLTHDISGLFVAAKRMESDTSLRFVLIGGGSRRRELLKLAEGVKNAHVLPFQPAEKVPLAMASGDVGLVALGKGAEGVSMPSKAYYMMSAGCALLGLSHGRNDITRLIDTYACGINVSPDDVDGIQGAIQRFRDDHDFLASCKRNSRKAAEGPFSANRCVPRYLELLSQMRDEARKGPPGRLVRPPRIG